MTDKKPFSLGKSERLKSRKQIDILFDQGKKITQFPFRVLHRIETGNHLLQAGFTVSSKNFPRAVDRNRIKRLSREAYRTQKKELESWNLKNDSQLYLFFIYTGREIFSYEEIAARMKQVLDKLIQLHYANPAKNS